MSAGYTGVVKTAQEYYDSDDADNFYFHVWGGKDIHIGLYEGADDDIAAASERTVAAMAERLGEVGPPTRIIDVGAGYGGAARWLVREFGCHVTCLNLSEAQNNRNRTLNAAQGVSDRIEVVDGSFEELPFPDSVFEIAWSQDSLLHSGHRDRVFDEVDRVLRPGGAFIFTDPMQADDCPKGVLQPVLDRIHLESLGSVGFYREQARRLGWTELAFVDLTPQLVNHYTRVGEELRRRRAELGAHVSDAYMDRMLAGLGHWVTAGKQGYLTWGILHFRKPA
jgi:sarcosine/dimethylglycine N-methyltransferase